MNAAASLYCEALLEHCRRPRHRHVLDPADGVARAYNPVCGDELTVYLRLNGEEIVEAAFEGAACAVSVASASLMTCQLAGISRQEARSAVDAFLAWLGEPGTPPPPGLEALAPVAAASAHPGRERCARLAWDALLALLQEAKG